MCALVIFCCTAGFQKWCCGSSYTEVCRRSWKIISHL